jgi:26S proteasome regulatory subunit N2
MFQRCAEDCEYEQAIGIALESRRLDIIKSIIQKGDSDKLLTYVLDVSMTLVQNLEFRNEVLRLLVDLYRTLESPDYISISQCLVHLNDPSSCAQLLKNLIEKNDDVSASDKIV